MGKNYKAWDIVADEYFREITPRGRLEFLVGFGVLAPSSHNAQPWKFKVNEHSIEVMPERKRAVPIADPKEKYLYTGLGCAIENIVVAADYFGLQPRIIYEPYGNREVAARIECLFSDDANSAVIGRDHLVHEIPKRCSNRNKYNPNKRVPEEEVSYYTALSGKGVTVVSTNDIEKRNVLAKIVTDSRVELFDDAIFRRELSKYKKNNLTKSHVGITGITMGFPTVPSLFAPFAIKHANVLRFIEKKERELFSTYSPTHLVISVKKETPQAWMKAGRVFQNISLRAMQRGISSAISILPHTTDTKTIKNMFRLQHNPYIFVRMGYAEKEPPHAPRFRAKDVLDAP